MRPVYLEYLINEVKLRPSIPELSSNIAQALTCELCGAVFTAIPKGKVANYRKHGRAGCKTCTHIERYEDNQQSHIDDLSIYYNILHLPENIGLLSYNSKLTVERIECGHQFEVAWYNIKGERGYCPACNKEVKVDRLQQLNEQKREESLLRLDGFQKYKKLVYIHTEENYKNNLHTINPNNKQRVLSGTSGYQLDHIMSIRDCYVLNIPPEKCAHIDNLRMIPWQDNISKKDTSLWNNVPEIFTEYMNFSSNKIVERLLNMINSHNMRTEYMYKLSDRHYLTLYLPDIKVGIYLADFQKVYQQSTTSKYLLRNIRRDCEKLGIQLLVFFEDEWEYTPDIVYSMVRMKLGICDSDKIYARNTTVHELDTEDTSIFLKNNHLQGSSQYTYRFGLYSGEELVSVMTFTNPRGQMKGHINSDTSIELSRFCSKGMVVGGASKLLKHAKAILVNHGYDTIFTFSDLRYSSGGLYETLGFNEVSENPPSYKYVIEGSRKHRWGFRKDMLRERFPLEYDPKLTEYQNMVSMGYDRVWDCGYKKYELIINDHNP